MRNRAAKALLCLLLLQGPAALAEGTQGQPGVFTPAPVPALKIPQQPAEYVGQVSRSAADPRKWDLLLRTKQDYSCSNAYVNARSVISGDHVVVHIDKTRPVIQPNICLTALGPATYSLALPALNQPLRLDISDGSHKDRYSIVFESGGASVNTLHAGFTFFLRDAPK